MQKRIMTALCALLCMILIFTALPMTSFADDTYSVRVELDCDGTTGSRNASGIPGDYSVRIIYSNYSASFFKDTAGRNVDISEVDIIYNGSSLDLNKTFTEAFGTNYEITVTVKLKEKCAHGSFNIVIEHSATCTEVGYKRAYKCTKCGHYFTDSNGINEIGDESAYEAWKHDSNGGKTADALGHRMQQMSNGKPATCKSSGYKPYWECTRNICSTYFEDADAQIPIGDLFGLSSWASEGGAGYIPQLAAGCHSESTVTITNEVSATCAKTGCKAYAYCKECKTYSGDYTLSNGVYKFNSTITNLNVWKSGDGKIEKLSGHPVSYVKAVSSVEPTCDADGCKSYVHCELCGTYAELVNGTGYSVTLSSIIGDDAALAAWKADSTSSGGLIPKLGHDYGDWTGEDGNDEQHKRVCGSDSSHVDYANHSFGAGTVTVTADDGAEGEIISTCTVCGYTKTEKFSYKVIEGDGSKYQLGSNKDLTITADGEFAKFTDIEIDGAAVDSTNYDAKSGSTIVTLKSSYLETLKVGKHTIKFIYEDGSCSGTFYIEKKSAGSKGNSSGSGTGDMANYLIVVNIFMLAAAVVFCLSRKYDFKKLLGIAKHE